VFLALGNLPSVSSLLLLRGRVLQQARHPRVTVPNLHFSDCFPRLLHFQLVLTHFDFPSSLHITTKLLALLRHLHTQVSPEFSPPVLLPEFIGSRFIITTDSSAILSASISLVFPLALLLPASFPQDTKDFSG